MCMLYNNNCTVCLYEVELKTNPFIKVSSGLAEYLTQYSNFKLLLKINFSNENKNIRSVLGSGSPPPSLPEGEGPS